MASTAQGFKWDFETLDYKKFECVIKVPVWGRLMLRMFEIAKVQLKHEKKIDTQAAHQGKLDSFELPAKYLPALRVSLGKHLKSVWQSVREDGILVLDWEITKCYYVKIDDVWIIRVHVGGNYDRLEQA